MKSSGGNKESGLVEIVPRLYIGSGGEIPDFFRIVRIDNEAIDPLDLFFHAADCLATWHSKQSLVYVFPESYRHIFSVIVTGLYCHHSEFLLEAISKQRSRSLPMSFTLDNLWLYDAREGEKVGFSIEELRNKHFVQLRRGHEHFARLGHEISVCPLLWRQIVSSPRFEAFNSKQ